MPLNKLQNFIKNTDGRTLYVNPNDLDATDSITNTGNSLAQPFKTIQRALLEAARFSFVNGKGNDLVEKTTILVFPGEHLIDNRPGFAVYNNNNVAYAVPPTGGVGTPALSTLSLELDSNFDLTQNDNILYKFNSVNGGVVIPRGTSIVGLDLRKTKIRPKYVPNPTDPAVSKSAIFRVTGACYFWQFSFFDADESGLVYTHPSFFTSNYQSVPRFSHHKLSCFEYADGVNEVGTYGLTDLDMYYSKLSNAFNSYRPIPADAKFPASDEDFAKMAPEWEIVGAFASDPIDIQSIISGNGTTASTLVTVTTTEDHNLNEGTPIKIKGVLSPEYNISTKVAKVDPTNPRKFTYLLESFPREMDPTPGVVVTGATVTVETDTVSGASPYIFNCSLRSVWGMNGMHADGSKASGFRSMVVAQFTAVSLQKDDRAFVKYDSITRTYNGVNYTTVYGAALPTGASQTDTTKVYHLDPNAVYRQGWETSHIKISNDSFIQVVSVFAIGFNKHFDVESGGDASITNSNSNFGQISLNSDGFKAEAFDKDNNAFITNIIPPRDINTNVEENIEWLPIDVGLTTNVTFNPTGNKLYLYGLTPEDNLPITLTQGYRIGAREGDKLYLEIDDVEYSANIYMQDGVTSSYVVYDVSNVSASTLTLGTHTLQTGEKIIINSETGDLPENVTPHIVYYAIRVNSTQIKLATSSTNASNNEALTIYGGDQLKVYSRVSDKVAGDIGSPIQFDSDPNVNNWYITVNSGNDIYTQIASLGIAGLSESTDTPYVKRIVDDRSLDEKIYKLRVVVPKELSSAKDPEDGFIIQESSTTGARAGDFTRTVLSGVDYEFNKNPRFITTCTVSSNTVTVLTSLPHNLNVNDVVVIRNVTDSSNTSGAYNLGYNGKFTVTSIVDDMSFTYSTTDTSGKLHLPGATSTNDINSRTTEDQIRDLPRFERNDLKSNLYIYRNEVISPYVEGSQDGIYHLYVLNSSNKIINEFTNLEYSQNPVDLYPQLDRDNINANPPASKSFALRSPIGEVNTSDLKKSVTRESIDKLSTSLGIGKQITSVSSSATSATLTFNRRHGFGGLTAGTVTAGAGYNDGTFYDVKLLSSDSNPSVGTWKGATAKVVVTGGAVVSAEVISSGSGYTTGEPLYFDQTRIGTGNRNARFVTSTASISTNIGDVVQITGIGTVTDGYYRISAINSETQITISKASGDPTPVAGQYLLPVGPSSRITSTTYNSTITTFNTEIPHGLVKGNKFRVIDIDSNNINLGDYVVNTRVDYNTFTAITNQSLSLTNGYILKHGYSANDESSDVRGEKLGARQFTIYNSEIAQLSTAIVDDTTLQISLFNSGIGTAARFSLGSYIQIDDEIMRITSSNNNSQINVVRGVLGTRKGSHDQYSLIRKVDPIAVEFRRPSIVRASGHTFEYLGYGPGNYSTGLPQVQIRSLTEREDFLVQSQERAGGIVVYSGMNNSGDFFTGNTKTSPSSGEITSYDIPTPTVTGEDPSRSSVIFDEVTVKERIVVEGGNSRNSLSQFDGPVTFNGTVKFNDDIRVKGVKSDISNLGNIQGSSLLITGGNSIVEDLDAGDITADSITIDNIVRINNNEITTLSGSGNLSISADGSIELDSNTNVNADLTVNGSANISSLTVDNNATISGILTVSTSADISSLTVDNDATISGILTTNQIQTSTGNLTINTAIGSSVGIQTNTTVSGNITANYVDAFNIVPIGAIQMWCGRESGIEQFLEPYWMECRGQELLIEDYPVLYDRLTWGPGGPNTEFPHGANTDGTGIGGTTHFRLPDLRGRFVAGAGTSAEFTETSTAVNSGATGGSANGSVIEHEHFVASSTGLTSDESGKDPLTSNLYVSATGLGGDTENDVFRDYVLETSNQEADVGITNSVGISSVNANLPPYYGLVYIIKVK